MTPTSEAAVLIVDDKEANLIAMEALLSELGCDIVRARSGNEALKQLLKREFALVLLDVQMPGMDGYEVAAYSRQHPQTRDVPIIFVTAMPERLETALRGYDTGAVDYLFKPIDHVVLRSKVRVFLDLYRARRQLLAEIEAHRATLAALELSNETLRHFTYAASHDLGAPLRAISGLLGALDSDARGVLDEESRELLDLARGASERMRALLDSLLVFAGLRRAAAVEAVDCNAVLERVRTDLADRITAAGATVEIGPLPTVNGDPHRIYQLFINLLGNALKFHRPGVPPVVFVRSAVGADDDTFVVEDNGIGVPDEQRARIFEAFKRLHTYAEFEGSGLGLAICQQIVDQHGGRIWVESSDLGGARFCFVLGAR